MSEPWCRALLPCYANWGGSLNDNGEVTTYNHGICFGKPGQIIIMELDLVNGELIYDIDGTSYGPAFKDIIQNESTKYKLAVSLNWRTASVKLVNFECISRFSHD